MTPTVPLQTSFTVTPLYTPLLPPPPEKIDRTLFEACLIACSGHYRLPSLKRHLTTYPFCKDQQMRDIQKKSVDFTRQRSAAEFFTLFTLYVFFQTGLWVNFWCCCHTYLTKNLRSYSWLAYLKFSLVYGYLHLLFA